MGKALGHTSEAANLPHLRTAKRELTTQLSTDGSVSFLNQTSALVILTKCPSGVASYSQVFRFSIKGISIN